MNKKSLIVLASITVVIMIAAAISSGKRAPQSSIETQVLLPELQDRINEIAQIIIESSDSSVHISKLDESWGVMQADNYPARFDKVKKLVLDTADLKILSEKTSNPAFFAELGVEDPASENAGSNLLSFLDGSGNPITSLIIGNTRSQDGLYVRKAGTNQTYLVSGRLDISDDPGDWIVTSLLNVDNERIRETVIEHPNGEVIRLTRGQDEEDFQLADIPDGRKARSRYFTNQPATFLADLQIQDAKSRASFRFPESPVVTTISTYDGLIATINSAKIDNVNHAVIDFSIDESVVVSGENTDETIVIGEESGSTVDVRQEAEDLNNKVRDWVFIIPQSKYLLLTKRIGDLTDTLESDSESAE